MITTLDQATVHETPNALMRRYPGSTTAVWRTEMAPGAAGPEHAVDVEQVVVVIEGRLQAELSGQTVIVGAGDAIALPAGAVRRLYNAGDDLLVTVSSALPGGRARVGHDDRGPVPWSA